MASSYPVKAGISQAGPSALRTIGIERDALEALISAFNASGLGHAFERAAQLIVAARGRVVVTGMGKSGHIGRKIAATLASTGTPSLFLHPAEASHGDLGMITVDDVLLILSWSGETRELSDILNYCARFSVPLIAMTSQAGSTLGMRADVCLTMPSVREACGATMAPTSSTTIQLALGDALAVALIEVRGFSSEDFRMFHPKGQLGAQLLTLDEVMSTGAAVPRVPANATILQATIEMSHKRFGITAIVDEHDRLLGAFTDGDLRRSLSAGGVDAPVRVHMTKRPLTMEPEGLASEALALMNSRNVSQLFVCQGDRLIGVLHLHDILRSGVV